MIDMAWDGKSFAERRDNLQDVFNDMYEEGIRYLKWQEVKRIAEEFRFNYASGKSMCQRAGIKVKTK